MVHLIKAGQMKNTIITWILIPLLVFYPDLNIQAFNISHSGNRSKILLPASIKKCATEITYLQLSTYDKEKNSKWQNCAQFR